MEDTARSVKEKHLTASVKIKIAHQGHGMLQDAFESSPAPTQGD
jgi:hypothetical protein